MDLSLCSSEICLKWTTRHLVHLVVSSNSVGAIYAAGGCDEGLPRMPCVESFCSAKKMHVPKLCTLWVLPSAKLLLLPGLQGRPHYSCIFMPFHACLVTQVEGHLAVGRGLTTALCAEPVIDVPWLRDPSLALNHERVRTNECAASLISLHYRFFIILIVNLFLLLSWFLWLLLLIQSLFL